MRPLRPHLMLPKTHRPEDERISDRPLQPPDPEDRKEALSPRGGEEEGDPAPPGAPGGRRPRRRG